MKISFITWVNNEEMYNGFLESARFIDNCEFIKIGQDFNSMSKAYNEGLRIIDIVDPSNPVQRSQFRTTGYFDGIE